MATNFVQSGRTITLPAPSGGVASGAAVHVGAFFGVAQYAALEGADVEVELQGVFELPKAAVSISVGNLLYWTGTNLTNAPSSGDVLVGAATGVAGMGASRVRVRLNGVAIA